MRKTARIADEHGDRAALVVARGAHWYSHWNSA